MSGCGQNIVLCAFLALTSAMCLLMSSSTLLRLDVGMGEGDLSFFLEPLPPVSAELRDDRLLCGLGDSVLGDDDEEPRLCPLTGSILVSASEMAETNKMTKLSSSSFTKIGYKVKLTLILKDVYSFTKPRHFPTDQITIQV